MVNEIDNESKVNEIRAKRIAAILLALTAGSSSALTGCINNIQNVEKETKEQEKILEETTDEISEKYENEKAKVLTRQLNNSLDGGGKSWKIKK